MTLRRRSAWEASADYESGFDIHDESLYGPPRTTDEESWLSTLVRATAVRAWREQQRNWDEARRLRARRISDDPREDGLERLRERWAG